MDAPTFDRWVRSHCAAFGGLRAWLNDNPDCVRAWRDCMADVEFDWAAKATRSMNRGDHEAPRGFTEHARAVRALAKRLEFEHKPKDLPKQQYVGDEPVYRCVTCKDTGVVEVANVWKTFRGARPLRSLKDGRTSRVPTCAVGCDCGAKTPIGLQTLSRETMFLIDFSKPHEQELAEFVEWWDAGTRYRRNSEFDAWNEQGARGAS